MSLARCIGFAIFILVTSSISLIFSAFEIGAMASKDQNKFELFKNTSNICG